MKGGLFPMYYPKEGGQDLIDTFDLELDTPIDPPGVLFKNEDTWLLQLNQGVVKLNRDALPNVTTREFTKTLLPLIGSAADFSVLELNESAVEFKSPDDKPWIMRVCKNGTIEFNYGDYGDTLCRMGDHFTEWVIDRLESSKIKF